MKEYQSSSRRHDSLNQRLYAAVFWIILLFCIFSYGANSINAICFANIAIYLILASLCLTRWRPTATRGPFLLAILLLGASVALALLQVTPLPEGLFGNQSWSDVASLVPSIHPVISVTPGDTEIGIMKISLPFGIFLISLLVFNTDSRAEYALKFILVAGGIITILSLIQFHFFPKTLIFGEKRFYLESLTGPFVNRNTAGTFFGLISLTIIAFAGHFISRTDSKRIFTGLIERQPVGQINEILTTASLVFISLFSLSALFLTNSRGASASTFLSLILMVMLGWRPKFLNHGFKNAGRMLPTKIRHFVVFAVVIAVIILVYILFAGRLLLRAEIKGLEDGRFCIAPGILSAMKDYWLLGSGLTSFREIFPAYRDSMCGIVNIWDKAHNSYAEGIISTGIVSFILTVTAFGSLSFVYIQGLKTRRRLRFIGALGLATSTLVALHALVDFSLQIPGLSAFYAALTAPMVTICSKVRLTGGSNTSAVVD